jgi:hypothetical protein
VEPDAVAFRRHRTSPSLEDENSDSTDTTQMLSLRAGDPIRTGLTLAKKDNEFKETAKGPIEKWDDDEVSILGLHGSAAWVSSAVYPSRGLVREPFEFSAPTGWQQDRYFYFNNVRTPPRLSCNQAGISFADRSQRLAEKEIGMCSNCGCGILEDKHDDERNINWSEIVASAEANDISPGQAVKNIVEMAKTQGEEL